MRAKAMMRAQLHEAGLLGEPRANDRGDRDQDEKRPQSELKSHGVIVS
jgi:hypothetical protein